MDGKNGKKVMKLNKTKNQNMNFWHIQMSKGLQPDIDFSTDKISDIITTHNIIGTGEWKDNRVDQCKQFKESIQIGDVVLVRNGIQPIALVEVEEKNIEAEFYENEHKVKLLALYDQYWKSVMGIYVGQSQGTLTRVANLNNPTGKFITNWYSLINITKKMKDFIDILKYKKQIILQGPPGTGKTRLAGEIATELLRKETITINDIKSLIKIGEKIRSITDYTIYQVVSISSSNIGLQLTSGNIQTPTFEKIISAYKEKKWNGGTTGGDAYEAAVAKHIYQNTISEEQFKIIQFHPAYSYEDFVRGISAISNGGKVEYKTENKLLGKFANEAAENYRRSQIESDENLSKEQWIEDKWSDFVSLVSGSVAANGLYNLTGKVKIIEVEEDCFKYKGEDWQNISRINFNECKKIIRYCIDANLKKADYDKNLFRHAYYRQTYYTPILDIFFNYNTYTKSVVKKEELQNYVLIIDEINRANLPAVLGELIYALEYRGEKVESMYSIDDDNSLILPPNLYIIGTMNTADRSVGHIDYAIRRRFAFVDVLPTKEPIKEFALPYFKRVSQLFIKNYDSIDWSNPKPEKSEFLAPDFRPEDVWLGHSYFITNDNDEAGNPITEDVQKKQLAIKLKYEVAPILKEYLKDGLLIDTNDVIKSLINELS